MLQAVPFSDDVSKGEMRKYELKQEAASRLIGEKLPDDIAKALGLEDFWVPALGIIALPDNRYNSN